jgi:hypothetical protein
MTIRKIFPFLPNYLPSLFRERVFKAVLTDKRIGEDEEVSTGFSAEGMFLEKVFKKDLTGS